MCEGDHESVGSDPSVEIRLPSDDELHFEYDSFGKDREVVVSVPNCLA